ncbi:MAG: hypothetical protein QM743_06780 [Chitinophagaceae bacterium]
MKKLIYALCLLATTAMVSCSKGDYSSGDGQTGRNPFSKVPYQNPVGTFTAKLNGAGFSAAYSNAYHSGNGGEVLIVGFKTTSYSGDKKDGVIISIPYIDNAIFDLSDASRKTTVKYSSNTDGSSPLVFSDGNVVIYSSSDGRIKGGFTVYNSAMNITEGTFDVPFLY